MGVAAGGVAPEHRGPGVSSLNLLALADPSLQSMCSGSHHPDVTHGMVDLTAAPTKAGRTPAPTNAPKTDTPPTEAGLEIQHEVSGTAHRQSG